MFKGTQENRIELSIQRFHESSWEIEFLFIIQNFCWIQNAKITIKVFYIVRNI